MGTTTCARTDLHQVGSGASVWYGAVVRGDVNHVVIGPGTSVGDSAVVHVAGLAGDKPTIVGSNVVIGEFLFSPHPADGLQGAAFRP